jgi:hypothetical protein
MRGGSLMMDRSQVPVPSPPLAAGTRGLSARYRSKPATVRGHASSRLKQLSWDGLAVVEARS